MNIAPIALFVYNRPKHTKQTVAALQNNKLSQDSNLFIFSDGPRKKEDEKKVKEVRNYIKSITGFKKIIKKFNIDGSKPNLEQQLIDNINKNNKTWAIKWYANILLSNGLCLHPNKSLIRNIC